MIGQNHLIVFLQKELAIPASAIELAMRQAQAIQGSLPMILWRYGLVDLNQLDRIFDWLAELTEEQCYGF